MCFYCEDAGLEHEQSSAEEITLCIKKNKTENVGTDQNSKLLSDPPHFHGSDMAEPGFDCVQILEDNRPWFRYPARIWEN